MAKTETRFVILLRGINVGGHNKLPMAELRAALEGAGYGDVVSYIQSGNIALTTPTCDGGEISRLIETEFGLDVPVVVRTAEQLLAAVGENPFPEMVDRPKYLHLFFCQDPIDDVAFDSFDHQRFLPDRVMPGRSELYVAYADGVAGSKLTSPVLDRAIGQTTTARNWRTVLKLVEMAERTT